MGIHHKGWLYTADWVMDRDKQKLRTHTLECAPKYLVRRAMPSTNSQRRSPALTYVLGMALRTQPLEFEALIGLNRAPKKLFVPHIFYPSTPRVHNPSASISPHLTSPATPRRCRPNPPNNHKQVRSPSPPFPPKPPLTPPPRQKSTSQPSQPPNSPT